MHGRFLFFRFLNSCNLYCILQACYLWKMLLDLRFATLFHLYWFIVRFNFFDNFPLTLFLFSAVVTDIWYTCKTDWNVGKIKFYHTRVHSQSITVWNPIFQAPIFLSGKLSWCLGNSLNLTRVSKDLVCILYYWGTSWEKVVHFHM